MRGAGRLGALSVLTLCACTRWTPSTTPLGEGPLSRVHMSSTEERGAPAKVPEAPHTAQKSSNGEKERDPTDSEPSNEQERAEGEAKKDTTKSADKSEKTDVGTWDGDYVGEDVTTYRFEGAPDRIQRDPNAKTRVKREGDKVSLTVVDTSNGKDLCTLAAKVDGTTASIDADQECFSSEEGVTRTRGLVKSGTARLQADKLVIEAELDFEFRAADRLREGKVSYRFEGKRN